MRPSRTFFAFIILVVLNIALTVSGGTSPNSTGRLALPTKNGDIPISFTATVGCALPSTGTLNIQFRKVYVERFHAGLLSLRLDGDANSATEAFGWIEINAAVYDDTGQLLQTGKSRSSVHSVRSHFSNTILFDLISDGPHANSVEISIIKVPFTSEECRDQVEASLMEAVDGYRVGRTETDVLRIRAEEDYELMREFRDDPNHDGSIFTFRGSLGSLPYYIVERFIHELEYSYFILVHKFDLTTQSIAGMPIFSPDGLRFVSGGKTGPNDGSLQIWALREQNPVLEWEIDFDHTVDYCAPQDLRWEANRTIHFEWASTSKFESEKSQFDGFPAAVTKKDDQWELIYLAPTDSVSP